MRDFMTNLSGKLIGQYRVGDRLGRGGMAEVYRAYHTELELDRAIKVIRRELAEDDGFAQRFRREAQSVAGLRHSGIVQMHDFGEHEGLHYMVMEFIDGEDLSQHLRREGRLSFDRAVEIVSEVASALGEAHRKGVVHRDIKPSNIMLTHEGSAILTDFGIAKMVDPESRMTQTGVGIGTPAYMAPEQARGMKDVGPEADLYALSVVLYELLTGEVPYDGETPLAVIHQVINDPMPKPSMKNGSIPRALEHVILKGAAKDPADRYASAEAFRKALEDSLLQSRAEETTVQLGEASRPTVQTVAEKARSPQVQRARSMVVPILKALWRGVVWLVGRPFWRKRPVWIGLGALIGVLVLANFLSGPIRSLLGDSDFPDIGGSRPINERIQGKIELAGQRKKHQIEGRQGDRISAVLSNQLGHAYLSLTAPDGAKLANLDGHQVNALQIRHKELPVDGTYTFAVWAQGANTGSYLLSIARPSFDHVPTPVNQTTKGAIEIAGKGYWHSFEASEGDQFAAVLSNSMGHAYMDLLAPDGSKLASADAHQVNDLRISKGALPATGRYLLSVRAQGANTGNYALTVVIPAYDRIETPVNSAAKGAIALPGKGYEHVFEGEAEQPITIVLDHSLGHAYLWLYFNGKELARREGHQVNDLVIRDFVLPEDGTYAVLIRARGANTGRYTLSVTRSE